MGKSRKCEKKIRGNLEENGEIKEMRKKMEKTKNREIEKIFGKIGKLEGGIVKNEKIGGKWGTFGKFWRKCGEKGGFCGKCGKMRKKTKIQPARRRNTSVGHQISKKIFN